jgi:hypothetical protein
MRFNLIESDGVAPGAATVCRISALGTRWRVRVESWQRGGGWSGRLVFEPDSPSSSFTPRLGPTTLHGQSQTEVLDGAHQLPERRLRQILHSFG